MIASICLNLSMVQTMKAHRIIFSMCLLLILINPRSVFAENTNYKNHLISLAKQQILFQDRYWDILLHYKPTLDGKESLIDDPNFFLAGDGKKNPSSELIATIESYFSPAMPDEKHTRCRFPARYAWLKESLNIDEEKLPPVSCPNLQETIKKISPKSTVLIFAAPFFSGSSKIFGHTLLRIDSDNEDHLLSYAVNYAAHTADDVGPSYILKGLTGGFKGFFSMLPYYLKIKEYSDIENRDIWEYYLNLSEEETYRMVLHVLELRDTFSDYYFLDENCSFNILFLLEAGRPSLQLVNHYWKRLEFGVIPLDTVNVVQKSGIVSTIRYLPSPVTWIRYLASQLDEPHQEMAKRIALHGLTSEIEPQFASAEQKRLTLELAAEYLKYRYSRMELTQEKFQELFLKIAGEAKDLGRNSNRRNDVPIHEPPESAHKPAKLDIGFGYRENSPFAEITFRPAYRDFLEMGNDRYDATQVKILQFGGRYYERNSTFKLQEATLLNIVTVSSRDIFFHPISGKFRIGFEQNLFPSGDEDIVFRLDAGGGWSFSHPVWGLLYALIEADMKVSSRFEDSVAVGPGATLGVIKKVTETWGVGIQGQSYFYTLGENYKQYRIGIEQRFELTPNSAIFLNFDIDKANAEVKTEVKTGWSIYF